MLHATPTVAFFAAVGVCLPFTAQGTLLRRQYLPVVVIAAWLFFANVVCAVNAILWTGSDVVRMLAWCDIATKFLVGVTYAIPACLFCIASRLRQAALPRDVPAERTATEQKDTFLVDLALCAGVPVIAMILHTVVQSRRFDVVEDIGCQPEIPAASAGTVFFWLPALVFALMSLSLCCMMLRHIPGSERGRLHLSLELYDPTLSLPVFFGQYMVVLCLSALWTAALLVTVYEALVLASRLPATTAVDWSRIDTYSWADFDASSRRNRRFCWWTIPAASFAFALFLILFPLAARIADWACRTCDRVHTQFRRRSPSVALEETSSSNRRRQDSHVVVRKGSVVTAFVEHSESLRHMVPSSLVSSTTPAHEPRWSIPWETTRPSDAPLGARSSVDTVREVVILELPIALVSPPDTVLLMRTDGQSTRQS